MSIKVTTLVWERSQATGSALLLLLKIADNCHDDGAGAHPGIAYLAKRARMSERNIQYNLRKLEALGELEIQRAAGRYGQNHYRVNVALLRGRPDTDESDTQTLHPSGVEAQTSVANGANQGISGAQPIAPKPLIEPIKEPSIDIATPVSIKPARRRPQRELPEDWMLDKSGVEYAKEYGMGEKVIDLESEKFFNYWRSRGELRADWAATWRTWVNTWASRPNLRMVGR